MDEAARTPDAANDDEGRYGMHTDHWHAKKDKKHVETIRRRFDQAGLPYRRIGLQRWYDDRIIEHWYRTGEVLKLPTPPRRGRPRRVASGS